MLPRLFNDDVTQLKITHSCCCQAIGKQSFLDANQTLTNWYNFILPSDKFFLFLSHCLTNNFGFAILYWIPVSRTVSQLKGVT